MSSTRRRRERCSSAFTKVKRDLRKGVASHGSLRAAAEFLRRDRLFRGIHASAILRWMAPGERTLAIQPRIILAADLLNRRKKRRR